MSSDLKLELGPRPLFLPGLGACPQFAGISSQALGKCGPTKLQRGVEMCLNPDPPALVFLT